MLLIIKIFAKNNEELFRKPLLSLILCWKNESNRIEPYRTVSNRIEPYRTVSNRIESSRIAGKDRQDRRETEWQRRRSLWSSLSLLLAFSSISSMLIPDDISN
jgi:hypothetical protein